MLKSEIQTANLEKVFYSNNFVSPEATEINKEEAEDTTYSHLQKPNSVGRDEDFYNYLDNR